MAAAIQEQLGAAVQPVISNIRGGTLTYCMWPGVPLNFIVMLNP
jgi:hypothetical protein